MGEFVGDVVCLKMGFFFECNLKMSKIVFLIKLVENKFFNKT